MDKDYGNYSPAQMEAYIKQLEQLSANNQTSSAVQSDNFSSDESIFTMASSGSSNSGGVDYSAAYDKLIDEYNTNIEKIYAEEAKKKAEAERKAEEAKKAEEDKKTEQSNSGETSTSDTSSTPINPDDAEQYRDNFDPAAIASSMHDAMKGGLFGWGTKEEVIEKYLNGSDGYEKLNDAELRAVVAAYQESYSVSLIDDIKGDFSFSTENKLVSRIQSALDNNDKIKDLSEEDKQETIKAYAKEFYDATTGKKGGTDEDKVWEIMKLDKETLKQVIEYYNNSPYADKQDFQKTIKGEFRFTFGKSDLLKLYDEAVA